MDLVPLMTIFSVSYGSRSLPRKDNLTPNNEGVPLVSASGEKNGVFGYFEIDATHRDVISVPRVGSVGQAAYQAGACAIDENCLVLSPRELLTRDVLLYYVTAIRRAANMFSYGRVMTIDRLGGLRVPALIDLPDWVIKRKPMALDFLAEAGLANPDTTPVDTRAWESFKYTDLFNIVRGQGPSLSKAKDSPGSVPYVTASDKNNGVSTWTALTRKHPGWCLTVATNGSVGECFVQPEAFLASSDVAVLVPKTEIPAEGLFFVATLIRREGKLKYGYGRKWGLGRMQDSEVRLPVDEVGQPDWNYMKDFVRALPSHHLLEA